MSSRKAHFIMPADRKNIAKGSIQEGRFRPSVRLSVSMKVREELSKVPRKDGDSKIGACIRYMRSMERAGYRNRGRGCMESKVWHMAGSTDTAHKDNKNNSQLLLYTSSQSYAIDRNGDG